MREHFLLSVHELFGLHRRHHQGNVHSQGHPPQDRKFRESGWQHIPLKSYIQFLPYQVEGRFPCRYFQDLSSLLLKRGSFPHFWVNFNQAVWFSTHPALQLASQVQHNQFRILDNYKEHRPAYLSSLVFWFVPIQ